MTKRKRKDNPSAGTRAGEPKNPKTKPAQKNAVNKSSKAGKRSGRGANKAAQPAPSAAPATEEQDGLFKFRRYKKIEGGKNKKAKHPKLIVEQQKTTVGFMGLTEDSKSGHHKNIPLTSNPKKGDKRKAYIRKELRHDTLDNFGEILENYNLSEEDKKAVIAYIKKRKKKK